MQLNGVIIQKKSDNFYQGIDGDNWPLYGEGYSKLDEFFVEYIEKSWLDERFVDVCDDMHYIEKYTEILREKNIEYRILLCETEKQFPQFDFKGKLRFIGYDYAYAGGSYYSAVLNDVVSQRIPEFRGFKLNEHGMFETILEVERFVLQRTEMRNSKNKTNRISENYLEEGDFTIFKLYEFMEIEE